MRFILFLFIFQLINADQKKESIKEEIAALADESQSLANELAEIKFSLEMEDLKDKAVKFVVEDGENVLNTLKLMEAKIEKLENHSSDSQEDEDYEDYDDNDDYEDKKANEEYEDNEEYKDYEEEQEPIPAKPDKEEKGVKSENGGNLLNVLMSMEARIDNLENMKGLKAEARNSGEKIKEEEELTTIKPVLDKEESLKTSLDKFKHIRKEVKNLATYAESKDENNYIFQMAKVLEAMTAKMSMDEVKISVDLAFGRGKKTNIVKNDIETMIDSLEGVVKQLKEYD